MRKSFASKELKCYRGPENSYTVEFVWYDDSTQIDSMISWLLTASCLRGYWTGFHDKDFKDDGTPDKPHFHTVCYLTRKMTQEEANSWLIRTECPALKPVNPNGLNKFCMWGDIRDAVRYLEHLDCKDHSKPRYDNLAPFEGLSIDNAEKWLKTPLYASKIDSVTRDPEASRKTKGILILLDIIHEQGISTFTELLCFCRDDAMLVRAIRENVYLLNKLLQESLDTTIKYSK